MRAYTGSPMCDASSHAQSAPIAKPAFAAAAVTALASPRPRAASSTPTHWMPAIPRARTTDANGHRLAVRVRDERSRVPAAEEGAGSQVGEDARRHADRGERLVGDTQVLARLRGIGDGSQVEPGMRLGGWLAQHHRGVTVDQRVQAGRAR